jgi:hypothetical protein
MADSRGACAVVGQQRDAERQHGLLYRRFVSLAVHVSARGRFAERRLKDVRVNNTSQFSLYSGFFDSPLPGTWLWPNSGITVNGVLYIFAQIIYSNTSSTPR